MVGIKKKTLGFRKGNQNGLSSIYNIRYDSELGICNADVRRIPCAYSFCVEQLDSPWDKNEKSQIKRGVA